MGNSVDFVKNNKIKVLISIIILILIIIGVYKILESKKKEYNLIEVSTYNYFILNRRC